MEDQKAKLKQLFANRVTNQARIVLDNFQKCRQSNWQDALRVEELAEAANKLQRFAMRFEMDSQYDSASKIASLLKLSSSELPPSDEAITALTLAIQELNEQTLRKSDRDESSDDTPPSPRTYLRTPIYLALNNTDFANRTISQLEFFGFRAIHFESRDKLIKEARRNKPETIVIDIDFGEALGGINAIQDIQAKHESAIPIIFISEQAGDIETRLMASRAGGEEFFFQNFDPGQLIEKIGHYTHASPQDPYRVLVVDDSKSQAKYIDTILKKAGMTPLTITDPMRAQVELEHFQPEIIIMDMYMPDCTGMELARVIRQQDKFHSVPIIYLSAEDDLNKQLHAMSQGGDDFLTKPIDPKHLTATIHNRGRRARSLLALMIRDSLTGLYNHTHIIHLLEQEIQRAKETKQALSFIMLDIDLFKKINDTHGHVIGDRVLKNLSMYLKQRLRKTDHVGRYGGEEFAIVLPNTSSQDAKNIMNEIRERFSSLAQPSDNTTFHVSFSCGIAHYRDENVQTLCDKADKALYKAKHDGRNTVRIFEQS